MNDANASTRTDEDFSLIALARRLGRVMDPTPGLFWTEGEQRGFGEDDFAGLYSNLPSSPRARRLAVAFAVAADSGMQAREWLLILADWGGTLLRRVPHDEERSALSRAVELATFAAGLAEPQAHPDLQETLNQLSFDEPRSLGPVTSAAAWVRIAAEMFVAGDRANGFISWIRAVELLGSIERAGGEEAIADCAQLMPVRLYSWAVRS
jgi:hypothetical protein